ncbi:hypothetical protein MKX01_027854, partial [Papaver californicum]
MIEELRGFARNSNNTQMSRRAICPPSKEWLTTRKGSPRFVEGVKSFIQFTVESLGEDLGNHEDCPIDSDPQAGTGANVEDGFGVNVEDGIVGSFSKKMVDVLQPLYPACG